MYLVKGRPYKTENCKLSSNNSITNYWHSTGQYSIVKVNPLYGFSSFLNRLDTKGILENVNTL